MLGSLKFRVALAALVMVAVVRVLYPQTVGFVSTSAFVNAPILSVRAPFDGVIEVASKDRAALVLTGEPLFELKSVQEARLEIARLIAQEQDLQSRQAALRAQMNDLATLSEDLQDRRRVAQILRLRLMDRQIDGAQAQVAVLQSELAKLLKQLERNTALKAKDRVPQSEIDDLRFDVDRAHAQIERASALLAGLQVEREAVQHLGLSGQGDLDTPYFTQRLDEISIRLSDLVSRRREVEGQQASVTQLITAIDQTLGEIDRFAPVAPASGLVWRASPAANATLVSGEEALQVLDCSRRYIEVTFQEKHFEKIEPGSVARVRLRGSEVYFYAPVTALRGHGNDADVGQLSAIERARIDPRLTLFLDIPVSDLTDTRVASAFCDVGRSAEVRILRPGFIDLRCLGANLFGRQCGDEQGDRSADISDTNDPTIHGG